MVEKRIKVNSIERKISTKTGKDFWFLNTSHGKMSCFEKVVADLLEPCVNKECLVDVVESNGYQNIRGFNEVFDNFEVEGNAIADEVVVRNEPKQSTKASGYQRGAYDKDPVALAVEILIHSMDKEDKPSKETLSLLMSTAVKLVYQAKKEFEQ